jgi:hypothetical protein
MPVLSWVVGGTGVVIRSFQKKFLSEIFDRQEFVGKVLLSKFDMKRTLVRFATFSS